MSNNLPFTIKARHSGGENIIFVAAVNGEDVTQERYVLGNGTARRRVASWWVKDDRLRNGAALRAADVERALEDAESRVRESLDRGEGCAAAGETQASMLVHTASQDTGLFHNAEGEAFATLRIEGHHETHALRSRMFKRWLSHQFYQIEKRPPNAQAMTDALGVIEGKAVFEGEQHTVHVRLAEHDGAVYLDLGDPDWTVVQITAAGWEIAGQSPVKFRRPRGILPLPRPIPGGNLAELRNFVNVGSEDDFILVVAWLIGAFGSRGPYPVLVINGEQGSAKSTLCRLLRELVDPNLALLRSAPRDERDLVIAAHNSRLLGFDNLSRVPEWLSNALCRLATGGGFSTRALFTDSDEMLFSGQRPILLNGITDVVTRSDLLDRAILVTLPPITDEQRRDEHTFLRAFDVAAPRILGALLDAVSVGLRDMESTRLDRTLRMADFVRWVVSAEPSLPWPAGSFMRAYAGNRAAGHELALEGSPVGRVVCRFMDGTAEWTGSCTDLLGELDTLAGEKTRKLKSWPKRPNTLGTVLRRISPNLRALGIAVEFGWKGHGTRKRRTLTLRKEAQTVVPVDPGAPGPANRPRTSHRRGEMGPTGTNTRTPCCPQNLPLTQSHRGVGTTGSTGTAICVRNL